MPRLSRMTRTWLIVIIVAILAVLAGVWLYTAWAADEVEPEVGDDVALIATAPPAPAPLPPTPPLAR